jgi:putative transposase
MKRMGVEAIYRRPNTSKPAPGYKIYPYLLRGLKVDRPNQAWAMDITSSRWRVASSILPRWLSRRVLSHRVSITMEADFCVEALEERWSDMARDIQYRPGQPVHSEAFTSVLIANKIAVSMDGKGAWRDNVFVERIWKSVKYEEVYLHAYDSVGVARVSIGRYLDFYNCAIEHPFVYVIVENRFCCAGSDPVGYLGFWRARSVIDRAVGAAKAPRANIQGPSGSGWTASISPASAARRKVFGATFSSFAASPRLSRGSTPSAAAQYRDTIVRTQRGDALARPSVAVAGLEIVAV